MAKTIERYSIDLETRLKMSDDAKAALKDIQNSLSDMQKTAEGMDFDKAAESLDSIRDAMKGSSENAKQYGAELKKAYGELTKQADKLQNSLNEQGKKDRERLRNLKAQASLSKAEKKELEALEKRVADLTDEELQISIKKNRQLRAQIKTMQAEQRVRKSATALIKEDLKGITERIKKQKEFLKTLTATGKAYYAIKKAGGAIARTAVKGAVVGAGIVGGLAAAGMAQASREVEVERESSRIKASMDAASKRSLVSSLYTRTGADTATIVDAINRVTTVLGRSATRADIESAAMAEIRMPGAAELLQSQSAGNKSNFAQLVGRLEAIQRQTGLSTGELSSVSAQVSRLGNRAFSKGATQTDLIALLGAMQGAGVFTDAEHQERALRAFVGSLRAGENIFAKAQSFDWARYAGHNQQARNRATAGVASIDWSGLQMASQATARTGAMTTAEQAAMRMRQMEETKNKVIMRVLEYSFPLIDRVMKWLADNQEKIMLRLAQAYGAILDVAHFLAWSDDTERSIEGLISDNNAAIEAQRRAVEEAESRREMLEKQRQSVLDKIVDKENEEVLSPETAQYYRNAAKQAQDISELVRILSDVKEIEGEDPATSLPQRSSGGLLVGRGIAGERGGELVLPLDYTRGGRASNIIQNISNVFNMSGNQTTARSLSSAVGKGFNRSLYADMRCGR